MYHRPLRNARFRSGVQSWNTVFSVARWLCNRTVAGSSLLSGLRVKTLCRVSESDLLALTVRVINAIKYKKDTNLNLVDCVLSSKPSSEDANKNVSFYKLWVCQSNDVN